MIQVVIKEKIKVRKQTMSVQKLSFIINVVYRRLLVDVREARVWHVRYDRERLKEGRAATDVTVEAKGAGQASIESSSPQAVRGSSDGARVRPGVGTGDGARVRPGVGACGGCWAGHRGWSRPRRREGARESRNCRARDQHPCWQKGYFYFTA